MTQLSSEKIIRRIRSSSSAIAMTLALTCAAAIAIWAATGQRDRGLKESDAIVPIVLDSSVRASNKTSAAAPLNR